MKSRKRAWEHFEQIVRPTLDLASPTFLDDTEASLTRAGIQDAVARRDSEPIFDWLMILFQLQGISDVAAFSYADKHGTIGWRDVNDGMKPAPACHRLRSYWHLHDCGYKKAACTCSEPHLLARCPLPRFPMRKGRLNQTAYSLFFFIRDVCDGDIVRWIDSRLAGADPGVGVPRRATLMRDAVLLPLANIYGVGPKLWSMALADLLLCGDPERERWVTTGAGMIAIDSLVHNFLHRTGVLKRFSAEHESGPACYAPGGCADLIEGLTERVDARSYNQAFPSQFARFVQHAIWHFCAIGGYNICNGNKIDDKIRCEQHYCPLNNECLRIVIKT